MGEKNNGAQINAKLRHQGAPFGCYTRVTTWGCHLLS
tara:strand:+ start:288 stop:398 length:111 start_codon:yes stop_codon:yes gene_type:complete